MDSVEVFLGENEDDVLLNDGSAQMHLIREVHLGKGVFGFSAVDGGGFTGIIVTAKCWEAMKAKVDAFLKLNAECGEKDGVDV
jgi:hypothetical protein